MAAAIIIPARYSSSRLPGKPLLKETGKYLIQHVYERASKCRFASSVLVATDDQRIATAVEHFGGKYCMTDRDHPSGTDRVAEAARHVEGDIIVNLQGDEPLIDPGCVDLLIDLLHRDRMANMATLATPLRSLDQYSNPNCVKVVVDDQGRALYFSRSPIPHVRDGKPDLTCQPPLFHQHVGIYAYRRNFLFRYAATLPSPLEQCEKLEQLRALSMGVTIKVGFISQPSIGVDTYEDYQRFVEICRGTTLRRAA